MEKESGPQTGFSAEHLAVDTLRVFRRNLSEHLAEK